MKDKILAGCLALLVSAVLGGFSTGIAGEAADQIKPAYIVVPTKKPPVIDGKLDDDVWENAIFTHLYDFLASTKEAKIKADPATTFAISADNKQLYVAFRCQDTNISKLVQNVTTRDGKLWNGDNVEIFLNFEGSDHTFRRVMLGASGAVFDAAYLQYGLKEHRWFDIQGLAGGTNIQPDHWTGEIAIPFAGLAMKSNSIGNWQINVCRSSQTKKGAQYYFSSWGVLKEKADLNKPNFFPINIIRATRTQTGVYDLFQEVSGIPQPTFTEQDLQHIKKLRLKQQFDKNVEDFPLIVIPPILPLESLLLYTDVNDNRQPITTDAHRILKREQSLEAMQMAMGQLPDRPIRTSLKDFNIRTTNTQKRGRYIKKHIHYDVADGEVVHAFLYEPLGLKSGEKRPGIIALHPTAKYGKQTFEGWPNSNFVTELAMQGFVVIVPDYPTIGESRDYDLTADRYESGPIKGVFNHMSSVDLLQLLPTVDPNRIGAIGHSLGGQNTVYLQAFDERVKVGISSCGWTTFRSKVLLEERLLATEYFMPFLKTKYNLDLTKFPFEYTDAFTAIAPRVFYSYSPANDGVHPGWGPATAAPVIQEYYDAYGAKDSFIFKQPPGDHHFPWTGRQDSYKVIRDTLNYHPHGSLGLLAERKGKQAIPDLKKALDDPSQKNRWVAAHHLGLLGDQSGLARMKQDLKSLAPNQGTPPPSDGQGHARLVTALEVAKVLAELGDGAGYALAAQLATKGASGHRWRAAEVLAYVANLDKDGDIDPIGILKIMAATEKDNNEFFVYLDCIHKIMRDRSEMIAIFAIAKDSKYQTELTVPWGPTVGEVYWIVASRDKNRPYEYK
ncbi:MAG: alpha/beta fold hydrolase [Pirellulaceae bacterium]|nr:alpha/beta fold hydrolase [Pirellulaceae bacterium]